MNDHHHPPPSSHGDGTRWTRGGSRRLQLTIGLAILACLLWGLGRVPLMDQDEGRNGEVAREMAASNDYVLPTLNGLPYLDKPIVYFAAAAAAVEVLGPTELAVRLPALLFTLATAALVWWFAGRRLGPRAAPLATVMFLSAPLTLAFARIVIFDSALTFFVTAAVMGMVLALPAERGAPAPPHSRRMVVLAWLAIGLGVLTKGPVALALPLLVALPIAIARRAAVRLFHPLALLVFAATVAPWVAGVSLRRPDFLEYVFVTETVARVATDQLKRSAPPWYYVPLLLGGAFPWSLSFAAAMGARLRGGWRGERLLWALWVGAPLVLFTLSNSKRPQYVLPLMVPMALASAHLWLEAPAARRRVAQVMSGLALAFSLLLGAAAVSPATLAKLDAPLRAVAPGAAVGLALAFAAAGVAALLLHRRPAAQAVALAAGPLLIPVVAGGLLAAVGDLRSTRDVVRELARDGVEVGRIVFVGDYRPSLTFYLRRPALLVSPDADEIRSNYLPSHFDELAALPDSPLRRPDWLEPALERCRPGDVFVVRRRSDETSRRLTEALPVLATDRDLTFFGPCPLLGADG